MALGNSFHKLKQKLKIMRPEQLLNTYKHTPNAVIKSLQFIKLKDIWINNLENVTTSNYYHYDQ